MSTLRKSGVLLHPTSLPGPHGIGDLGAPAFRFIDWLQQAGQQLWQVMPLNPTGMGDSPYSSPSAFAGNPLLISLEWLKGDGLLTDDDLAGAPDFPESKVDFAVVVPFHMAMLHDAFSRFRRGAGSDQRAAFEQFIRDQSDWLDGYALFMAVKEAHNGLPWMEWDEGIRTRDPKAVAAWSTRVADQIRFHQFVQFQFFRQWDVLKRYANERGILIIGDIPIFVSGDSADVWQYRTQFKVDAAGVASEVAGVPPDPFSATGQIWGNPAFNWPEMAKDDYLWWRRRVAALLKQVDIVRIDHFRGFAAAWLVPAGAEDARAGHWELAPGGEVFRAIRREIGDIPIIIEDLGVITPDVIALRETLDMPGMKVLQFAFDGDPENDYLPHNYRPESVVYTATHDNQTTVGWFWSIPESEREHVRNYLGRDGSDIAWDLIRLALLSPANTAILSMQDILRLDDSARMNVPGQALGNWSWRVRSDQLDWGLATGLRNLVETYGRLKDPGRPPRGENPWDYTRVDGPISAVDPFA
ncbi:MAG: 4-alpha-glucanotransferase [Thermomicrobiales bacterium]